MGQALRQDTVYEASAAKHDVLLAGVFSILNDPLCEARCDRSMEQRRPLYTEVARAVVDTDGLTPDQVADAVLEALELEKR